jgi:hypothetical protein
MKTNFFIRIATTVFVIGGLLSTSCHVFAQERIDTIYYDKDWKGVSNREAAAFYRIAVYPVNTNYKKHLRDYFITGELQGTGGFISVNRSDDSKSVFDGETFSYFKNGNIESKRVYQNGKLHGEYCVYFEDGHLKNKMQFINGSQKQQVEYRDGRPWQYYMMNGLMVAMTNTTVRNYGKWHGVDIVITNNSPHPVEFNPEKDITAYSVDRKERRTALRVWDYNDYMKKVRRAQNWAAVAVGFSEGMATANAGYSTSTTNAYAYGNGGYAYGSSVTTSYNAAAAYQARALSQQRIADFSTALWNEQNTIQMGYLKRNTIYPGQTVSGYVYVQRIAGVFVYFTFVINGTAYAYAWTYGK